MCRVENEMQKTNTQIQNYELKKSNKNLFRNLK